MTRPQVNISLSNGNLGLKAASENGTTVLIVAAPVAPKAGYGVPFLVKNKAQAADQFVQTGNEAVVTALVDGFYAEAPEGTKLYVLAMARTTTLAAMMGTANADKALNMADGKARLVAAIKFPNPTTYDPTITNGFDDDVHAAVTAGQTLANAWFDRKKPFRFFIEGFAFVSSSGAKDYNTAANRNGHIVAGEVDRSTALATMLAVGRAAKVGPQENIGKVKSGSLNIAEDVAVTIGGVALKDVPNSQLQQLWDKRYITFEKNAIASGFIFQDDNSLTVDTDDYNNLRYGRVIDNATREAFTTYYKELKDDVDVDETTGRLDAVVEKALENAVETAIDQNMRSQLSKKTDGTAAVYCLVNPDPTQYAVYYSQAGITDPNLNILQTNQAYLFLRVRPKGCLKYLNVYLGFTL